MLTSTAHRLLDDVRRLFGPDKGSGMTVPVCDVGLDMPDQRRHGVERAAPDRLAGEDAEPGLDHVEPGGTLRSEVEVDLRMPSEPCLHRGRRMRGRVVEDDVQGTPTIAGATRLMKRKKSAPVCCGAHSPTTRPLRISRAAYRLVRPLRR